MREAMIQVVTEVMFTTLMAVIAVLFAYLSKLFAKSKRLEHIALAMNELEGVVTNIVGDLQQTVVDGLKEASADGKLSKDDIEWLGKQLIEKASAQISAPAAETLVAAGVDIEGMIHSIAEAWIAEIKRDEVNYGDKH